MINAITTKTKCDVRDCKNDAQFCFETKGRQNKCFLCAQCLARLSADGRAMTVPKSPKNAIKRQMDKRVEEANRE